MGIGASIFLVAVGAILAFAVTADVQGMDIATVGWILMIVGIVGFLLSLSSTALTATLPFSSSARPSFLRVRHSSTERFATRRRTAPTTWWRPARARR